jgi:hypothetical protein
VFSLEVIWRAGSAYAFVRGDGDAFTDGGLQAGEPGLVHLLDFEIDARRLTVPELIEFAADPPADLELGDSAKGVFALVELAQRSVSEGMVHPQLTRGGGSWYAFWGSTLADHIQARLDEIATALPLVAAEGFHSDRDATVGDLYPQLVDQIARDRIVTAGVRLGDANRRRTATEAFLQALSSEDPELPANSSYASLERRISRWVDDGLAEVKDTTWRLALHLDERPRNGLALELWLHAGDDPTLALPVSMLWEGGEDGFAFVRGGDPLGDLEEQLAALRPLLATEGIEFDDEEPVDAELDAETASYFLRQLMPQLEQRNVSVLLPAAWLRAPTRLRANMTATSEARTSSGLLSSSVLASFDWRLAVGDTELSDEDLRALAAAKSPVVQVDGQWQAVRPADVKRALRFLERRRQGVGFVDLVRAVSGLETDEAGLELGSVQLDASLDELLSGKDARFRPRPTPKGMRHELFPFQERGHGWLRMLGDLGIGAILADDMGLGKTVQAIAMLVSEREELVANGQRADALGPTLVVCPMSVARQWVAEVERFAPGLRVHLHHGSDRLANEELQRKVREVDVVVTSYDIATRDVDVLAEVQWDRLLMDEAQDVKNPATKRARALRTLPARRRVAMTGTPIENRLSELWAIMDILNPGLVQPDLRAADRGGARRGRA